MARAVRGQERPLALPPRAPFRPPRPDQKSTSRVNSGSIAILRQLVPLIPCPCHCVIAMGSGAAREGEGAQKCSHPQPRRGRDTGETLERHCRPHPPDPSSPTHERRETAAGISMLPREPPVEERTGERETSSRIPRLLARCGERGASSKTATATEMAAGGAPFSLAATVDERG